MIKKSRKLGAIFGIILLSMLYLCSCSSNISESIIQIKLSEFSGEKQKNIELNDDEIQLNLDGTISLSSGSVQLYLLGEDTNEILYSKVFTTSDNGEVSIDVTDLKGNLRIILGLKSDKAKDFSLDLTSKQKLVKDKEKPEVPSVPTE
ncbi:hypothetical protein [Anaerosporobacter sp.]